MRSLLVPKVSVFLFVTSMIFNNSIAQNGEFKVDSKTVALYDFNKGRGTTLTDISGHGHDGIIYGASWVKGMRGNALYFDGVDDYVIIPHDDAFNFYKDDEFTLEFWIKPKSGSRWFVKGQKNVDYNWGARDRSNGDMTFARTPGDPVVAAKPVVDHYRGKWMYVAIVQTKGQILCYINGSLYQTNDYAILKGDVNSKPLYLGTNIPGGSACAEFVFDQFRISKGARSSYEIYNHWKVNDNENLATLIVDYGFDEGSGKKAIDASAYRFATNNGLILGEPKWEKGVEKKCIRFDGLNDKVRITSDPPNQSTRIMGDLTIEAWIKPDKLKNALIAGTGWTNSQEERNITFYLALKADGMLRYQHEYGAGITEGAYFTERVIEEGVWTYVTLTREFKTKTIKFYVDGSLIETYSYSNHPSGGEKSELYIGHWSDSRGDTYFDGCMDNVRIYDRVLSSKEIAKEFNDIVSQNTELKAIKGKYESNNQSLTACEILHYPFNGNAKDVSGNGNDGIVNGATLTTDRFGKPNSAYKFDGVNDYIVVDGSGRYEQHTITLWFKTTVGSYSPGWSAGILFGNNNGATANAYGRSSIFIKGDHLMITGGYNEPAPYKAPYTIVQSSKEINDDKWHFVAAYFNSKTNEFKLYIDVKFLGSNSRFVIPLDLKNNNTKNGRLEIGARTRKGEYYKGKIDDIRIFNCELSEKEILALAYEQPKINAMAQRKQNCITAGKPVYSNGRQGYSKPKRAFDCNFCTNWNAGQYKPRWLSVDLEDTIDIKHLRFYVVQRPKGLATHQVYTSLDMKNWIFVEEFTLNTVSGDFINRFYYPVLKNVRGLKIITTKSPSWVAWRDIEINPTDTFPKQIYAKGPVNLIEGETVDLVIYKDHYDQAIQWLLNGKPIDGATNPTFTVTQSGEYRVEIVKGECSHNSLPINVDIELPESKCPEQYMLDQTNCVTNGSFGEGNVSFNTDYRYVRELDKSEGVYGIVTNPRHVHAGYKPCYDVDSAGGSMMVINGSTKNNAIVWEQKVNVLSGTTYVFSMKMASLSEANMAELEVSFNGTPVGPLFIGDKNTCKWKSYIATWESGNLSSVTVSIIDKNKEAGGNDFAIDDIRLCACVSYSIPVLPSLPNKNNE